MGHCKVNENDFCSVRTNADRCQTAKETGEWNVIVKIETDTIMGKMEELCTLLLQQEAFQELRRMIDEFIADEEAIEQYE